MPQSHDANPVLFEHPLGLGSAQTSQGMPKSHQTDHELLQGKKMKRNTTTKGSVPQKSPFTTSLDSQHPPSEQQIPSLSSATQRCPSPTSAAAGGTKIHFYLPLSHFSHHEPGKEIKPGPTARPLLVPHTTSP